MTSPAPTRPTRSARWRGLPYLSGGLVAIIVLGSVFGPFLMPEPNAAMSLPDRLLPPGSTTSSGATAWFGTDALGRDLLLQVMEGGRVSLILTVITITLTLVIGTVIGVISGYVGGFIDTVIMRFVDIQLALPSIVLAIVVTGALGPSPVNLVIAMVAARWTAFARLARGSTLSLKKREYVDASRLLGKRWPHIIRVHILPFLKAQLLVLTTLEFGSVVLQQAALSFLGIGLPPEVPSWGATISVGQDYLDTAWWISTFPGAVLALLVVAVGFLTASGEGQPARSRRGVTFRKSLQPLKEGTP